MATKIIPAFFTVSGVPTTGLAPTITIWELSPDVIVIVAGALIEVGSGWYRYNFTTYDYTKSYVFTVDGGASLNGCERYKIGGYDSFVEDISFEVWEEPGASHLTLGTTGFILNSIKSDTTTIIMSVATLTTLVNTLTKFETNRTRIDPVAKTLTVYDLDCVTPLQVFELKDQFGNPSVVEVCERVPIGPLTSC